MRSSALASLLLVVCIEQAFGLRTPTRRLLLCAIEIMGAYYGTLDVTDVFKSKYNLRFTSAGAVEFYLTPSSSIFDNPSGSVKTLNVAYRFGNAVPKLSNSLQGLELVGSDASPATERWVGSYIIYGAFYGDGDVTAAVASLVAGGTTNIHASNSVFGDPLHGETKTLAVLYRDPDGVNRLRIVSENGYLNLAS